MNITALKTVCRFLFDEILRHVIVLAIFAGIGLASPAKAVDGSITAYVPAAGLTKTVFIPIAAQSGGYTGDDTPEVSAGWISCPKRGGITSGSYAVAQCVITVEPNSGQGDFTPNPPRTLLEKYCSLGSPFYTVDFAELADGSWKVIETGDGGVSGLSDRQDAGAFYRALHMAFR